MQSSKQLRQPSHSLSEETPRQNLGHDKRRRHGDCQSGNARVRILRNRRRTALINPRQSILGYTIQPLGTSPRTNASRHHKADTRTQRLITDTTETTRILRSRITTTFLSFSSSFLLPNFLNLRLLWEVCTLVLGKDYSPLI